MISFFCARSLTLLKALQGMKSVKIEAIQGVSEADTSQSDPPLPCIHCIGRAEMSFQSLLLFCLCFTAFVSELFLMHDFCCKNVSAKPPLCLLSFTAGRSLLFLRAKASSAGSNVPSLQDKPLSPTCSASLRSLQALKAKISLLARAFSAGSPHCRLLSSKRGGSRHKPN